MKADGRMHGAEGGFTVVEITIVVVIIGILVAMATPVFFATRANAEKKTCFANQRTLEGAIPTWIASNPDLLTTAAAAGVVNASHPLITSRTIATPPRCPAAPAPADSANPTVAEGAYEFDAAGDLIPCTFGSLGEHGRYSDR